MANPSLHHSTMKTRERIRLLLICALLLATLLIDHRALAGCLDHPRLTGVNFAGAEFGSSKIPGKIFHDYVYPSNAELEYVASQGANIIRLPFLWERLQPVANGPLNSAELGYLHLTVTRAKRNGLCVLLDLHNYAKYFGKKVTATLPDGVALDEAFSNVWLALAREFPDANAVAFGLMNEPANISKGQWAGIAQQTILVLRAANTTNIIFVAGGGWSGLHDWFAGAESSNAHYFQHLHDPLNRTLIEVHQYTDSNYSGTHSATTGAGCRSAEEFTRKFERIEQWAKRYQQQLFLGEFGVPQSSECLQTLTRFMELMKADSWRGWSYWAAGSWWGNYTLALSGANQAESAQWPILKEFFYRAEGQASSVNKSSIGVPISPPLPPTPKM
jgi:endoglucanase